MSFVRLFHLCAFSSFCSFIVAETLADSANKVCCKFDQGPCNYKKGGGPKTAKGKVNEFEQVSQKWYKNPATGVPPSLDKVFMAAYLMPTESAYMEVETNFAAKRTVKFQEYKATQDISLRACCETDAGCKYDTGPKTDKSDFHQWYAAQIECPASTTKIIFFAENNGPNEGGVGIDNISVLDAGLAKIC